MKLTEHVARKARPCDDYPGCRFGIVPGQRYRRIVYFPGETDVSERRTVPLVLEFCAGCCAKMGRPITGALVEVFRLEDGEYQMVACGVITQTQYLGENVQRYTITDAAGVEHETGPHNVETIEPVGGQP